MKVSNGPCSETNNRVGCAHSACNSKAASFLMGRGGFPAHSCEAGLYLEAMAYPWTGEIPVTKGMGPQQTAESQRRN